MEFAKWLRPINFAALTTCFHILLMAVFQSSMQVYQRFKATTVQIANLHKLIATKAPTLHNLGLTWTFSWVVFSAIIALSVQLIITAAAWHKFHKILSFTLATLACASVAFVFIDLQNKN